ncbi:Methyltransferase type [Rhodopirellula maiorica SM1]|uniref:Methyltransferase type n=1 Tax=Rhodopirellula maiorica SM1 TaxID=1265738 RepID=M5RRM7_9BACT|nr:methyltransferase domain-containing protein [Rhodopirellula maiorica]EMI18042.1 Methyltransferase type [Rhodopirellula maiorica SM1]
MQRNLQHELMDDPDLPRDQHELALKGLSRLNRFTGVAGLMYRHLRRRTATIADRPLRILDVASGAGDVPIYWARRARRDGIAMEITMLDVSPVAVQTQQRRAAEAQVTVQSVQADCLAHPLPRGFDVVTSSLFMHHLSDEQVETLLRAMKLATDGGILICDLHRSRLNLAMVAFAGRVLSRSPVVHTDSVLSVQGAYTHAEFQALAQSVLGGVIEMHPAFPCRFLASYDKPVTALPPALSNVAIVPTVSGVPV